MKNIYLVGFMGTGKTVVGNILAGELNREFVEMDSVIEEREGRKIVDIFAEEGEQRFRELESELLKELSGKENLIVSCGGGLICNEDNLRILKSTGIVFSLKASALTIYERTKKDSGRPLLNVDNPLKKIEGLLAGREPYYNQAHYTVDTEGVLPKDVSAKILNILNNG